MEQIMITLYIVVKHKYTVVCEIKMYYSELDYSFYDLVLGQK